MRNDPDNTLSVRLSSEERSELTQAAYSAGVSVPKFVLNAALAAAAKLKEPEAQPHAYMCDNDIPDGKHAADVMPGRFAG